MRDTTPADRFALRFRADGAVRIEIGHTFTEADAPALVAAENALRRARPVADGSQPVVTDTPAAS